MTRLASSTVSVERSSWPPNVWDAFALLLVLGLLTLLAVGARDMAAPMSTLDITTVSLDPRHLPYYALRSTLRMLLALVASILFTFLYGTIAAKSRRAGVLLVPILDVLQSVPILGFLSITVTFFMALVPGSVLGAELEDTMAATRADETLRAVIGWGRYGEIFAYDERLETFSLENPS